MSGQAEDMVLPKLYGIGSKEAANASIPGHSDGREDM